MDVVHRGDEGPNEIVISTPPAPGSTLVIRGYGGDDLLEAPEGSLLEAFGGPGNDTIRGGGADLSEIWGGAGDDVLILGNSGYGCHIIGGLGNDYLQSTQVAPLGIYGWYTTLYGGEGDDTMVGSTFGEWFVVDSRGDVVLDVTRGDNDHVRSFVSYRLSGTLEALVLDGERNLAGFGNGLDNRLDGNNGDNLLAGGNGDDYLLGWRGSDTFRGGLGADEMWSWTNGYHDDSMVKTFQYRKVTDSDMVHGRDSIGFFHANDIIDLAAIDADPGVVGDQAFVFLGEAAFGADATGQLRFEIVDRNRIFIMASIDADADAEMVIRLVQPGQSLTAADFVL